MTISVSTSASSAAYAPTLDVDSAAAILEAAQVDLADQVGESMASRAKLVAQLTQSLNAQTALAAKLRERAADSPSSTKATLGVNLSESDDLAAQLQQDGLSTGSLGTQYLWVTRTDQYDSNGNLTGTTVAATWRPDKLSDGGNVGTSAIPADDWSAALASSPDASLLTAGASAPPSDSMATTNPTSNSDGSATVTSTYCFESEGQLIVDKSTLADWTSQIDTQIDTASLELKKASAYTRFDLSTYKEIVDQTDNFLQTTERNLAQQKMSLADDRQAEDLRLQQRNFEFLSQVNADSTTLQNDPSASTPAV